MAAHAAGAPPQSPDELLAKHLGLVYQIARSVTKRVKGLDFEDAVRSGTLGLLQAAGRFDRDRGFRFATFAAARIRGAILDECRTAGAWTRPQVQRWRALQRAEAAAVRRHQCQVGVQEIARELGVSLAQYWAERDAIVHRYSLETDRVEVDGRRLRFSDVLADPGGSQFIAAVEQADLVRYVQHAMRELTRREQQVMAQYYIEGLTDLEIGRREGVTESRICQIRRKAIGRLRQRLGIPSTVMVAR